MASTNKTTNLELSQFIGTDKPAWLTDYNGDMSKIDTAVHTAQQNASDAVGIANQAAAAVAGKQDVLTFDDVPTYGSNNPAKSGGIYTAIANAQVSTDAVPTQGSTKPVQSGGVYDALAGKQDTLTFDATPTNGSTNPVTSGGVYNALATAGNGWTTLALIDYNSSGNSYTSASDFVVNLPEEICTGDFVYEVEVYACGVQPAGTLADGASVIDLKIVDADGNAPADSTGLIIMANYKKGATYSAVPLSMVHYIIVDENRAIYQRIGYAYNAETGNYPSSITSGVSGAPWGETFAGDGYNKLKVNFRGDCKVGYLTIKYRKAM